MKQEMKFLFRQVINEIILRTYFTTDCNPHEPDYIANLVLNGTPKINEVLLRYPTIWSTISAIGVFCHQSPMVSFNVRGLLNRCELGDLLLCHFHTDSIGNVHRNAMLFQSKMSGTIDINIPSNDSQLTLYRDWPGFQYYRSGPLNRQNRDVRPNQPHPGAQYMVIDTASPITYPGIWDLTSWPIGTTTVSPELFADTPFENTLTKFFFGYTGRGFEPFNHRNKDGWSNVVWDLIQNGMGRAFNRRRAGFNNSPRISPQISSIDGTLSYIGNLNHIYNGIEGGVNESDFFSLFENDKGNNNQSDYLSKDEGGAPSLLLFFTSQQKE